RDDLRGAGHQPPGEAHGRHAAGVGDARRREAAEGAAGVTPLAPLAPVLRGRGVGGEGAEERETTRRTRETRGVVEMDAIEFTKSAQAWNLPWAADWVTAVCLLSKRRVAAGNNLGEILLWELPEKPGAPAPSPARRLDGHTNVINRLLTTPDGRWLISC